MSATMTAPVQPAPQPKLLTAEEFVRLHSADNAEPVTCYDSFVRTRKDPDTLRGTDICYFTYERVPKGEFPEGLLPIVPDMAIEVRSPSERWTQVFAKVLEYLEAVSALSLSSTGPLRPLRTK
jgi:hypothetical protein